MIRAAMAMWRDRSHQLIGLTKQVDEEEREKVIEQIEQLLDDRDKLQAHIVQPFTAEEEEAGRELVQLEKEVQANLARFMKDIRVNIVEAQAKKENMGSYVNPYGNINPDGAYYDTKQ
ncbi:MULTISPECIES: hypothetical protein [unclassified Sporosarcina]|uniref:hypothetical protein n=1 Tax=unclassified Sporosarcina TaxID=2647733 RepID=UPI00204266EF|nr:MULTISPECIES: hypothetical protein [unclassified Sporosarcina]GKV65841.1 hypothetical protein NCCP2331_19940 [Sporosarcina sp. NCCP-2331]GLB55966.1 hypothetical protein NCCP2378_17530 [Sporosarcina sp. NCCP-2378]